MHINMQTSKHKGSDTIFTARSHKSLSQVERALALLYTGESGALGASAAGPVLQLQPLDPRKLADIVGDQNSIFRQGVGGDEHVQ